MDYDAWSNELSKTQPLLHNDYVAQWWLVHGTDETRLAKDVLAVCFSHSTYSISLHRVESKSVKSFIALMQHPWVSSNHELPSLAGLESLFSVIAPETYVLSIFPTLHDGCLIMKHR